MKPNQLSQKISTLQTDMVFQESINELEKRLPENEFCDFCKYL